MKLRTAPASKLGPLLCLLLLGLGLATDSMGAPPAAQAKSREPAEEPIAPPAPFEVAINPEAGRGGLLIIKLGLEGGEELPVIVDTGSPGTVLDKSLEPRLGERLGERTIWALAGKQQAGLYRVPRLYLGASPVLTGSDILTADLHKMVPRAGGTIKGILGMDSLRHYCLQLDFEARKLRFLDAGHLDTTSLGKAFPLTLAREEGAESFQLWIHSPNPLGGAPTNSVLNGVSPQQRNVDSIGASE